MELLSTAGLVFGSSWTSGINLYLTTAGLGIAHRLNWIVLPGDLEILSNPWIIAAAVILYTIEFFADKIPYVDSAWDAVHTAIRPIGGAVIAYLATTEAAPVIQAATTLVGGTIALDAHATKAGTRAAINTSPEPISNAVASITEDSLVVGSLWLIARHPWVMAILVVLFVAFSVWLLPKIFRFFTRIFGYLFGKKPTEIKNESAVKD